MRHELSTSRDGRTYSRAKFAYADKLLLLECHIVLTVQLMVNGTIKDWCVYDNHKDVNMSSEQVLIALENAKVKNARKTEGVPQIAHTE